MAGDRSVGGRDQRGRPGTQRGRPCPYRGRPGQQLGRSGPLQVRLGRRWKGRDRSGGDQDASFEGRDRSGGATGTAAGRVWTATGTA